MSGDRLEAWELKLAAQAVRQNMMRWADSLGTSPDLLTLWRGAPALACEAIERVVRKRHRDICRQLVAAYMFSAAAFLHEVYCEWNYYRYDFITAVMKELGIEYEL